jgi:hypothetical protein
MEGWLRPAKVHGLRPALLHLTPPHRAIPVATRAHDAMILAPRPRPVAFAFATAENSSSTITFLVHQTPQEGLLAATPDRPRLLDSA